MQSTVDGRRSTASRRTRAGRHDLLRQDVERRIGNQDAVEFAVLDGADERGAFEQFVARGDEQASLGNRAAPVPGASDALQGDGDGARRADLDHQIDGADINSELQRCGRHQHAEFAVLELVFGGQAQLARQAAVVRGDGFFAQLLRQVMRHALGHAARVHEHQRGTVLPNQFGNALVDLVPHLVGGHRAELDAGDLDLQVHGAAVADVDDGGHVRHGSADP